MAGGGTEEVVILLGEVRATVDKVQEETTFGVAVALHGLTGTHQRAMMGTVHKQATTQQAAILCRSIPQSSSPSTHRTCIKATVIRPRRTLQYHHTPHISIGPHHSTMEPHRVHPMDITHHLKVLHILLHSSKITGLWTATVAVRAVSQY